ncbi:hypothetical protein [Alkalimarinus alittae]|uniref:Uncharacterized protein n=1 Tax=Alkalimarinus alittae TaxID=2961619 RepID=A0ABY6MX50_9ALTE|nr:hypothetical protein [Alkalimarinus alittae]UZE94406.1 hypothetical protein NKI27_09890 [Alkalimarinus alittae]
MGKILLPIAANEKALTFLFLAVVVAGLFINPLILLVPVLMLAFMSGYKGLWSGKPSSLFCFCLSALVTVWAMSILAVGFAAWCLMAGFEDGMNPMYQGNGPRWDDETITDPLGIGDASNIDYYA